MNLDVKDSKLRKINEVSIHEQMKGFHIPACMAQEQAKSEAAAAAKTAQTNNANKAWNQHSKHFISLNNNYNSNKTSNI